MLCFTLTGCLGMAGLGHHAVAVTINNLTLRDGGVGLLWPALVRMMLVQPSVREAYAYLQSVPLSAGHHYMLADGADFHGVECSGELKVRTQNGPRAAHLHTNHCFDPILRQRESIAKGSSTFARLNAATTLYAQHRPSTVAELWSLLGSHVGRPRSICSHLDEESDDPHASKTCARLVMRLRTGQIKAAKGCSHEYAGIDLSLQRYKAPPELPPGSR